MPRRASLPAASGFTMIEVLIAMLVIGTGALAVIMLQLQALHASRDNARQTAAAAMAAELAELRAAWRAAAPDGDDPYLFSLATGKMVTIPACQTGCDFATAAITEWSTRLARELPGARATVCHEGRTDGHTRWDCDDDAGAPVVIKLGWQHMTANPGATAADAPAMSLLIGR